MAIHNGTNFTPSSTSFTDANIFDTETQVQIASSIGYPVVSTTGAEIILESGWKYYLDVRLKASDSTPSSTENIQYILSDMLNSQISSVGSLSIYSETTYNYIQEKCITYLDYSNSSSNIKLKVLRTGAGGIINSTVETQATNFRSFILIKAWK